MGTLSIPAAYLEDAIAACRAGVQQDAGHVANEAKRDLPGSMEVLRRNVRLLETLLEADDADPDHDGDVIVEADADRVSHPIAELLEAMIRQTVAQLERECQYGPLPTGEMVGLVEKLRWAVEASPLGSIAVPA